MINALPLLLAPEGYQISRSVRLRSSASAYLSRTFGTPTNNRLYFFSTWVKRGTLGARQELFDFYSTSEANNYFFFTATDTLGYTFDNGVVYSLGTTAVFRDPSSWYHVCLLIDTAQATAANRVKIYVNGVQQTLAGTYLPQNTLTYINGSGRNITIGRRGAAADFYFDGYLTEINFIDGQALDPSSFGETDLVTGVWKPKKYTGTYGANGFYLNFSDNSAATAAAIGKDSSGNGNNWTPTGISVTAGVTYDSMLDVPTMWADGGNGRGNYATLFPSSFASLYGTISNANLTCVLPGVVTASGGNSTISMSSGKWYWEGTYVFSTSSALLFGVQKSTESYSATYSTGGVFYYGNNGNKFIDGTSSAYGATYTTNDVIGVALDLDAGTVTFYKNNVSQGSITLPSAGTWTTKMGNGTGSGQQQVAFNFGQRPFAYTPPTGFKALNTQNLPDSTIPKGSQYFNIALAAGASIKSAGEALFTGDELVWIKDRANVNNHQLVDTVRGLSAVLQSNTTAAETTYTAPTGNSVAWAWKEGPTQGFDIVTYTGDATINRAVAHSLGVQPSMFIIKARSAGTTSWIVHHKDLGNNGGSPAYLKYLLLNTTDAAAASTTLLPVSNLSSTTFPTSGATNNTNVNGSGTTYVAYLFAEVAGFSEFGSYTGNGSADGPFVYLGFRPKYVLYKNANSAAGSWIIWDSEINPINVADKYLLAHSSTSEGSSGVLDILSSGFKVRTTEAQNNGSGNTIIYMAFAENPFKYALAR